MMNDKVKAALKMSMNLHLSSPDNPESGGGLGPTLGKVWEKGRLPSSRRAGRNPLGDTEIGPGNQALPETPGISFSGRGDWFLAGIPPDQLKKHNFRGLFRVTQFRLICWDHGVQGLGT